MHVRMERSFTFKDENGGRTIAPRGWVGDLPDAVAKEAIEGGFAVDGNQRSATPVSQGAPAPEAPADDLDGKAKPDLETIAKERGVDISAARTKADIIEALRKA